MVAKGPISVPLPTNAVSNKVLGDSHVGVTLMHIHCMEFFEGVANGDLPLVAWPISSVKLVDDGMFLGDIMKEAQDNSADSIQVIQERFNPPKRAYHSTKRKKIDHEEKNLRDKEKKKNKRLEDGAIKHSRSLECCALKCCQNTSFYRF
jgi:hypothetical protein